MTTHTHTVRGIRDALLAMEQAAINAIINGHPIVTVQNWIGSVYVHFTLYGLKDGAWSFGVLEQGKCLTTSFDVREVETGIAALVMPQSLEDAA